MAIAEALRRGLPEELRSGVSRRAFVSAADRAIRLGGSRDEADRAREAGVFILERGHAATDAGRPLQPGGVIAVRRDEPMPSVGPRGRYWWVSEQALGRASPELLGAYFSEHQVEGGRPEPIVFAESRHPNVPADVYAKLLALEICRQFPEDSVLLLRTAEDAAPLPAERDRAGSRLEVREVPARGGEVPARAPQRWVVITPRAHDGRLDAWTTRVVLVAGTDDAGDADAEEAEDAVHRTVVTRLIAWRAFAITKQDARPARPFTRDVDPFGLAGTSVVKARLRLAKEVPGQPRLPLFDDSGRSTTVERWARRITRRCVGFAASGGGALAFFHLAVLEKLREHELPIDIATGSSGGALVMAYFCASQQKGISRARAARMELFKMMLRAVLRSGNIADFIDHDKRGINFGRWVSVEDMDTELLPFTLRIDDDGNPRPSIVVEGSSLGQGVQLSGAAPLVFGPAIFDDDDREGAPPAAQDAPRPGGRHGRSRYFDGGVANHLPLGVLIGQGADLLIGSTVAPPISRGSARRGRVADLLDALNVALHASSRWNPRSGMYTVFERPGNLLRAALEAPLFFRAEHEYSSMLRRFDVKVELRGKVDVDYHDPEHRRWLLAPERGEEYRLARTLAKVINQWREIVKRPPARSEVT